MCVCVFIAIGLLYCFTANFCSGVSRDKRPHPNNCHQYIQCHDGYTRVMRCSIGLCFNPDTQDCDIREKEEVQEIGKIKSTNLLNAGIYFQF